MRRFRVLHAKMGDRGYTCQVKYSWFSPWKTLGYRTICKYRYPSVCTYEDNSYYSSYSTRGDAERRMDYEIKKYQEFLEHERQLRAFKPTVVKEWP